MQVTIKVQLTSHTPTTLTEQTKLKSLLQDQKLFPNTNTILQIQQFYKIKNYSPTQTQFCEFNSCHFTEYFLPYFTFFNMLYDFL